MDCDPGDNTGLPHAPRDDESRSAVNSLILDYYKKFGRKRDLEQYFSLSTAQSDIRDPSSIFWARMKAENESSDSGERSDKKSDSSQELCRISIRFPAHDPCTSQDEDSKSKTESTSPPIIIEELSQGSRQNYEDEVMKSEDDGVKSDDNSQKSYDVLLDTSMNKLHSPSSSITSQRRLEWDSLADVGYGNESDRKTSASSLSTLERLALKQQYSNNDTQHNNNLGVPTAHSTPMDENDVKSKKKGVGKKSTKIYKKDIDLVEVNVPHSSMNPAQSINVNLTKHISFNVEKDGKVTVDNVLKDISVSPEKVSVETEALATRMDREMQTSLTKTSNVPTDIPDSSQQKIPILISLNTLKSRVRRRRIRMARRKHKTKKRADKENIPVQEKSGEQLSEAESFEYMPGHIYNQNQMTANSRPANNAPNAVDNKSSLESSGILTSDSSKGSKHSFTKDLEKGIDLLKSALKQRCDDSALRKQLIQQVCKRLLNSRYRDDESTTDFLSGLSFSSKKLGLDERNNTTTSTSDANNSAEKPRKSILRADKFNPGSIASTSQSVPNLPVASKSENLVISNLTKNLSTSNTESDMSSKGKTSSDNGHAKTSEELYKKYLQALKREEAYKKHLKDKEMFLKQKLVCSDGAFKIPAKVEVKPSNRLKDLINDLTRNNYDDGSGDASKLEGGPNSNKDLNSFLSNRAQRSQSVFTLSSGIADKKPNLKKKLQCDLKDLPKPGPSKDSHYCCCPHHGNLKFVDSSVQVNIKESCSDETCPQRLDQPKESPRRSAKIISDDVTGNLKYVCLSCKDVIQEAPDDFLIYKCSRLNNRGIQLEETVSKSCNNDTCDKRNLGFVPSSVQCLNNKSSQTNMLIKMLHEQPTDSLICTGDQKHVQISGKIDDVIPLKSTITIYESTRWIQTEISINPKISEPTLSDINIVSDTNCTKLISEHTREIPKSSLTDVYSNQAVASSSAISDSYKSTGTYKNIGYKIKNYDEIERFTPAATTEQPENYTIPLHGTNMTLMVSIGSERMNYPNKNNKEMVTECIGTDKVNAIEQATSLREECSKGVQSNNISDDTEIDHNSNNIGEVYSNKNKLADCRKKSLIVNTCITAKEAGFGTYPQSSPINECKPLRRAHTDPDKVQSVALTTNLGAGKCSTQTKSSIGTGASSEYNSNQQDACPCGCKGKREYCKLDCVERKFTQHRNLSLEKGISTQVETESCACGCGGLKDYCKEDCIEKKSRSTPRSQSQNQSSCRRLSAPENWSDNRSEKCPCGCSGTKNNCKKSCKECLTDKPFAKKQCGTQPFEQTSTQTIDSFDQSDSCSCGCGGNKNSCKKSCKERKSSLSNGYSEKIKSCGQHNDSQTSTDLLQKGQCGKLSVDKEMNTQTDITLTNNEKCLCGCGGFKDNCKSTCSGRNKPSPRNQVTENKNSLRKPLPVNEQIAQTDTRLSEKYQCVRTFSKEIDTQTDTFLAENEMCPCGCGGVKSECERSCIGRTSSPRYGGSENKKSLCSKQSTDKQIDTQRDLSPTRKNACGKTENDKEINISRRNTSLLTKSETCSCGCGNEKGSCSGSCKELRTTPRSKDAENRKCGTQSHNNASLNILNRCDCGCGGTKDNCGKDCKGLKSTPREQTKTQDQTVYSKSYTPKVENNVNRNKTDRKESGTQKSRNSSPQSLTRYRREEEPKPSTSHSPRAQTVANYDHNKPPKITEKTDFTSSDNSRKSSTETEPTEGSDPIINLIQNITKKYTKSDIEKSKRKKCFKEIMTVLNYLLDTDESPDSKEQLRHRSESSTTADETDTSNKKIPGKCSSEKGSKKLVDKGVQPTPKKSKPIQNPNQCATESSEILSTDIPATSSDSAACKVLNKIKKECEKYHQKRCKIHGTKICDGTSSTSVNCDQCRRVHHCQCRSHKCKNHKKVVEKMQKSPVAYNLILQTSESVISEGQSSCEKTRTLKNIIVKVPKKKPHSCMPFREMAAKFEKQMTCGTKDGRFCRSKSLPNDSEISSMEELIRQSQGATVREYLEKNRPDFIEKCSQRQTCMRYISEARANERAVKRDMLSLHLAQLPDVTELDQAQLDRLAADLGRFLRNKKPAPKLISEREMKRHSQKIYRSLPEVVQRREEQRKEGVKRTNLLMADMFKRNLQKKTLRGAVNLSNYSSVIKI